MTFLKDIPSWPGRVVGAYRAAYAGLPRAVWLLSAVLLVNRAGTMVLTFLALYLTQELGASMSTAGQVLGVYGLGHLIGAFVGGWLTDRVGPLRVQILALALSGAGFLALEHAQTIRSISVVLLFTAIAAESFRPANGAALAAFTPSHLQARAVALNRMALNLGFAIGPAFGGLLAAGDDRWLFRVDGLTCLAAAALLGFLFRGRLDVPADAPSAETIGSGRPPLRDGAFVAFLVISVAFSFVFFQGWGTYAVYLKEHYGLNEVRFGLLMTMNGLLILIFEMLLTARAEAFSPMRVVGFGIFLLGVGYAVLPLGGSFLFAAGALVIWTFGEMLSIPAAGGWVANRAGAAYRGRYMGLYTMAWGLAFIIAPPTGAWIYDHWGPDVLWYLMGGLGVGVWIACEALRRVLRREHAHRNATLGQPVTETP